MTRRRFAEEGRGEVTFMRVTSSRQRLWIGKRAKELLIARRPKSPSPVFGGGPSPTMLQGGGSGSFVAGRSIVPSLHGFTLVELLVVIAIIGILVSMMLPAIQSARESARRTTCTDNMRRMILAVHNYELAEGRFPPGTVNEQGPIQNLPEGHHISWIARILPYLEEPNKFRNLDLSKSAYHRLNDSVRQLTIPVLICPSESATMTAMSSYAGSHHDVEAPIAEDNQGVFFLGAGVAREDLVDGAAYTLFLGEKCTFANTDLGWLSGTPATLRNTGPPLNHERHHLARKATSAPWLGGGAAEAADAQFLPHSLQGGNLDQPLEVGGFGSYHVYGANFALGDGSVRFYSEDIPESFLRQLANRQDGGLVDGGDL